MTTWTVAPALGHLEREILTAMIISDSALRNISVFYKPQYLIAEFGRDVARWCLDYQERYNEAPKEKIQTLFEMAKQDGLNPESARSIYQLLSSLSEEFERIDHFNDDLAVDTALKYFRMRSLIILKEDLDFYLQGGDLISADVSVADYIAPAGHVSTSLDIFSAKDEIREAFDDRNTLMTLPGDLGKLIGPLERECLMMVVGKYKGSKSFTCQYIAQQAYFNGLQVAWFDFELGQRRLIRRFSQGLCAQPLKPPRNNQSLVPVWDCGLNQQGECYKPMRVNSVALYNKGEDKPKFSDVPTGYKPCTACNELDIETWLEERPFTVLEWGTAWNTAQSVMQSVPGGNLRVQTWPKFTAGAKDVRSTLHIWKMFHNFNPDLIVIDQPDDMFMEGRGDPRQKIDDLWKTLAAITQEYNCCLVAPSQAGGKQAQERSRLKTSDVAEDSRKLAHVDMSIRIDQTEVDQLAQRAIFSVGVGRDDESTGGRVMVLQALGLGQAVLDSRALK